MLLHGPPPAASRLPTFAQLISYCIRRIQHFHQFPRLLTMTPEENNDSSTSSSSKPIASRKRQRPLFDELFSATLNAAHYLPGPAQGIEGFAYEARPPAADVFTQYRSTDTNKIPAQDLEEPVTDEKVLQPNQIAEWVSKKVCLHANHKWFPAASSRWVSHQFLYVA